MSSPLPRNRILVGDARTMLRRLPTASIDTVVTSPPYFRLRNYQHPQQIGLEESVDGWVDELRLVLRGLARVLKPTGSLWLNLGDSYARQQSDGAVPKSLLLAPERVARAMQQDGWTIRNKVIWAKSNPMPTSVRDRLSCTYELLYFATRERHYYFDLDAIREPHQTAGRTASSRRAGEPGRPAWAVPDAWQGPLSGSNHGLDRLKASGRSGHPLGKNPGDVWSLSTAGFRGAHHATFPEALVRRPLLASCPAWTCTACGRAWQRPVKPRIDLTATEPTPACDCRAGRQPGVVLDPFMGSGTTAVVAEALGRDWLGIEVNPDFAELARQRIAAARQAKDDRRAA